MSKTIRENQSISSSRSSDRRCSINKGVLKSFAKFRLRPAIFLKKRLWHRRFLVNFAEFLRTLFLLSASGRRSVS